MKLFAVAVQGVRQFLVSLSLVRWLLPYHLQILFGGLGLLFLRELLYRTVSYSSYDTLNTLFNDIPVHVISYYAFFAGAWLTLISKNARYLPYGLWGYAFLALFPFEYLTLFDFVRAALYAYGGYALYRYASSPAGRETSRTSRY